MKKICLILTIFIVCIIIACNKSSSDDPSFDFIDPRLDIEKDVSGAKGWNGITGIGACPSGKNCNAVIYIGATQVGFAIEDSSSNNLKIYWNGGLDIFPTNAYTAISNGTTVPSVNNLDITITQQDPPNDKIFQIKFNAAITIGTIIIANGATINAYQYP